MPGRRSPRSSNPSLSREARALSVERVLARHDNRGKRRALAVRDIFRRGGVDAHAYRSIIQNDVVDHDFGRTLEYYAPIHAAFQAFGKTFRGKRFLHLGSSFGLYAQYLQSKGVKAVALDANELALRAAQKIGNKRVVFADANAKLPFRSHSFNFILSDHFLLSGFSQLTNEASILNEVHRVLAPKGIVVLSKVSMLEASVRQLVSRAGFDVLDYSLDKVHHFWVLRKRGNEQEKK